jgi:hypothetical protein
MMQKVQLVLKDGQCLDTEVENCHDAGVLVYVTNFGSRVRAFRLDGVARFTESDVVYILGRDEQLEGVA